MPPPLLSRTLDPILGVATGIFAYYLYESHPRTALPSEMRLLSLLKWKRDRMREDRERKLLGSAGEDAVDWQALAVHVEADGEGSRK